MPPKTANSAAPPNEKFVNDVWTPIERALQDVNLIVSGEKGAMTQGSLKQKMEWYSHIYNAATKDQKMAEVLYRKLRSWIESDLSDRVTRRAKGCAQQGDTDTLFKYIAKAYDDFKIAKRFGTLTFSYLDAYLTKKSGFDRVEKLYLKAFHKAVYEEVKKDLMNVILRQVTARRDGNQVDMQAVRSAMEVFTAVGTSVASDESQEDTIYRTDCESYYLQNLAKAYEARAQAELNREGGHYSYLQWVQSRYDLEQSLATQLLRPNSLAKVMDSLDKQCLRDQMKTVILHPDSGFATLLEDWKEAELHRMFHLFRRIPQKEAVKLMADELKKRVILEGEAFMKSFCDADCSEGATQIEKPLVENVLGLFDRYKKLISSHFENDLDMQEALKKGFETFVNGKLSRKETKPNSTEAVVKETSSPEVLASYTDSVLRREFKDIIDPEAEAERLDKIVNLFTFLKDKDVYQEFCKAKLAKRLLQTTPNEDLERSFLEKLQRNMGSAFTHKMEGMLHDRDNTKTIGEDFQKDESAKRLSTEFQCQVLTAGHWPAYKSDSLEPHESLRQCMNAFSIFYKKKYATRTLNWIHMLGSSTLLISFPKGPKDVTCSTYQASILCLVDDLGTVSAGDIAQNMKLDLGKVVKPNIASMYISKQFPLLVSVDATGAEKPVGKTIADTDLFKMNSAFQFKIRKFKLTAPSQVASSGMPESADIDARRKAMMDACVVRVMKSRKELHYNELLDLCITQLSKYFAPQPKHIKQRVEDLIGRGYLKRNADDAARFEYLA